MVYCYLEFKFRFLKILKLFSIIVKELWKLIVLWRTGDGFLHFLKAFSWETDVWVTLGNFTVKHAKIGKGNLFLTENRLNRDEMWYVADKHIYMCHIIYNYKAVIKLQFVIYVFALYDNGKCDKLQLWVNCAIFECLFKSFLETSSRVYRAIVVYLPSSPLFCIIYLVYFCMYIAILNIVFVSMEMPNQIKSNQIKSN